MNSYLAVGHISRYLQINVIIWGLVFLYLYVNFIGITLHGILKQPMDVIKSKYIYIQSNKVRRLVFLGMPSDLYVILIFNL